MALPVSAADCTAQVSLAMRAYESDCIRPHIWATTEALLARLFAPIASDDDRQAERTDRPMPTFEDALAQHHGLSLPDPEPPCTREAMFDVEVADWTPRNRTIELWFTRADLEPVSESPREPLAHAEPLMSFSCPPMQERIQLTPMRSTWKQPSIFSEDMGALVRSCARANARSLDCRAAQPRARSAINRGEHAVTACSAALENPELFIKIDGEIVRRNPTQAELDQLRKQLGSGAV